MELAKFGWLEFTFLTKKVSLNAEYNNHVLFFFSLSLSPIIVGSLHIIINTCISKTAVRANPMFGNHVEDNKIWFKVEVY